MIAFILGALKFLRINWAWVIPSTLLVLVMVDDGIQRIHRASAEAAVANDKKIQADNIARAQAKVREELQKDIALGKEIVARYAGEIAGLQGDLQNVQIKLAATQSSAACQRTPAADAFDSGVQSIWDRARKTNPVQGPGPRRNQP